MTIDSSIDSSHERSLAPSNEVPFVDLEPCQLTIRYKDPDKPTREITEDVYYDPDTCLDNDEARLLVSISQVIRLGELSKDLQARLDFCRGNLRRCREDYFREIQILRGYETTDRNPKIHYFRPGRYLDDASFEDVQGCIQKTVQKLQRENEELKDFLLPQGPPKPVTSRGTETEREDNTGASKQIDEAKLILERDKYAADLKESKQREETLQQEVVALQNEIKVLRDGKQNEEALQQEVLVLQDEIMVLHADISRLNGRLTCQEREDSILVESCKVNEPVLAEGPPARNCECGVQTNDTPEEVSAISRLPKVVMTTRSQNALDVVPESVEKIEVGACGHPGGGLADRVAELEGEVKRLHEASFPMVKSIQSTEMSRSTVQTYYHDRLKTECNAGMQPNNRIQVVPMHWDPLPTDEEVHGEWRSGYENNIWPDDTKSWQSLDGQEDNGISRFSTPTFHAQSVSDRQLHHAFLQTNYKALELGRQWNLVREEFVKIRGLVTASVDQHRRLVDEEVNILDSARVLQRPDIIHTVAFYRTQLRHAHNHLQDMENVLERSENVSLDGAEIHVTVNSLKASEVIIEEALRDDDDAAQQFQKCCVGRTRLLEQHAALFEKATAVKSQKDALKGQREILSMRKKKLEREMAKVAVNAVNLSRSRFTATPPTRASTAAHTSKAASRQSLRVDTPGSVASIHKTTHVQSDHLADNDAVTKRRVSRCMKRSRQTEQIMIDMTPNVEFRPPESLESSLLKVTQSTWCISRQPSKLQETKRQKAIRHRLDKMNLPALHLGFGEHMKQAAATV